MIGGPDGFEETFASEFDRVRNFGRRMGRIFENDAGFRGPGEEKTNGPAVWHRMGTEHTEGIGVARGEQRVDAGFQIGARLLLGRCCGSGQRFETFERQARSPTARKRAAQLDRMDAGRRPV